MKIKFARLSLMLITLFVAGCSSDSRDQVEEEITIPVAVTPISYESFQLKYHSIGRVVSENQVNLLFQSSGQVDTIWAEIGDYVTQDQRLARIDTDVYQTMYAQAKSMFEKAKRDLESSKSLYESKVISSDQYEMARIGLDNARAAYTQARNSLDNAILKAPFAGWIVAKNLNVGDLVAPGAGMNPPFILADMNHLKIIVPVPEARIGQIEVGQDVSCSFKTFPDKLFTGEVLRIGMTPRDFSNNYDVEIRLNGDVSGLKLGLIADVYIILESFDSALVLPLNAIQDDGVQKFVYVAKDGRADKRDIEVKALAGSKVLAGAEIEEGELLITQGHNDVNPNSLLNIVE